MRALNEVSAIFEAPRDLRNRKVQIRFDRLKFQRAIMYFEGERMGEVRPSTSSPMTESLRTNPAMARRTAGQAARCRRDPRSLGLAKEPFSAEDLAPLPQQREVLETLRVHCQQGGLCVIVGDPGTGKSVIKHALCQHDPRIMTPEIGSRQCRRIHPSRARQGRARALDLHRRRPRPRRPLERGSPAPREKPLPRCPARGRARSHQNRRLEAGQPRPPATALAQGRRPAALTTHAE